MTNPYESPSDMLAAETRQAGELMLGIDFISDWSPAGLRQRRVHWRHRLLDLGFACVSVLWIGSLLMATGSPYTGLFCVLTPTWVLLSVTWISSLSFRSGDAFQRKYRGLAGKIHGRIDAGYLVLNGPSVSVAAQVRHCHQCKVSPSRATLQPPGFDTALPIVDGDIKLSWPTTANPPNINQQTLLNVVWEDCESICAANTLRGKDLRTLPCWRIWRWSGWMLCGLGIVVVSCAIYQANSLPAWIFKPPGHYQFSKTDTLRTARTIATVLIGSGFVGAGLWQWARTWRHAGNYSIAVCPARISIANHKIAFSYHNESLRHFRWTASGLIIRDAGRRVLFAIPAHWFEKEEQQSLQKWYGRSSTPPSKPLYLGPKF